MNILKRNYFVAAIIKTKKKNSSRIETSFHNGIIPLWIFHRKTNQMMRNLTLTFANNIAAQNEDLEIKEVNIVAFNRV